MSLLQVYMEPCQIVAELSQPDDEGGKNATWMEGTEFDAAVVCDSSLQARIAERERKVSKYTVTCAPGTKLKYHDVFRRLSDGKIFRVTSDGRDVQTPKAATFQFSQVTAEEWELTT